MPNKGDLDSRSEIGITMIDFKRLFLIFPLSKNGRQFGDTFPGWAFKASTFPGSIMVNILPEWDIPLRPIRIMLKL